MSAPAVTSPRRSRLRWAVADTQVVARRHLLRLLRRPDELLGTLLLPVMAVLMLGVAFGGAFGAAMTVPGGEYREFLMPGLFALTMAFGIGTATISVAADARDGVLDRMRSLPSAPVTLLTGRVLADLITAVAELAILMCLGLALGWRWDGGPGALLAGVGLLLLLRAACTWVGVVLGLLVSGPESAMKYFALVFPLAMVADTVVPTPLMPPWLVTVAEWNPLSATVIAVRDLFGNPAGAEGSWVAEHAVVLAVAWPPVIIAACLPLGLARLRRLGR